MLVALDEHQSWHLTGLICRKVWTLG